MENGIKRVAVIGMTGNNGGVESVIMNIYRNIDREKVQFDFLIPHGLKKMAYEQEVLQMGGRIFRILYGERESFVKARTSLLNYFKENPEVKAVHLHANFPYAFPLKMAKKADVPVRIIHAHSSVLLFHKEKGIRGILKSIRNTIVYRQVGKYSNIYFSCSDLAAKSTFRNKEYIWIKNGINLDQFKYNPQQRKELRTEYNIKDNEKVIGFVGRLCEGKNAMFALEIFKEYLKLNSEARLIYVGDGEQRKDIEVKIKEYKLESKVLILGMISDTHRWYQVFDLLLLPSLYEGLPMVLVEAQTSGIPCIVSDTVTRQVNVTNLLEYQSNDNVAKCWAEDIDKKLSKPYERSEYKGIMYKAGFDIVNAANEVMEYYM